MNELLQGILSDRKKLAVALLVLLLILCLDFNFVLKNRFNRHKELRAKVIRLKNDIKQLNKDLSALQAEQARAQQDRSAEQEISRRLIGEDKITQLLDYISQAANARKVKIMHIKPSSPSVPVVARTRPKAPAPKAAPEVSPLLINLEILADYHQLGRFINDLENGDIFMEVEGLRISASEKEHSQQKVSLILKTYVKK